MEIRVDARVSYPVPDVFATYRDHIVDLIRFLPNIRGIEVALPARQDSRPG